MFFLSNYITETDRKITTKSAMLILRNEIMDKSRAESESLTEIHAHNNE